MEAPKSFSLKSHKPKHFDVITENHHDAVLAYFSSRTLLGVPIVSTCALTCGVARLSRLVLFTVKFRQIYLFHHTR